MRPARSREALIAGLAVLGLAAIFTAFVWADVRQPAFQGLDDGWRELLAERRTGAATAAAQLLADLGRSPWSYLVLGTVVIALVVARRRRAAVYVAVTVLLTTEVVVPGLKSAVERLRPPEQLVAAAGYAFPSGHAAWAAALAAALMLVSGRPARWLAPAVAFALAMMWCRTYLSVHWLSDVVAGGLIGFGVALLVWSAVPAGSSADEVRSLTPRRVAPASSRSAR